MVLGDNIAYLLGVKLRRRAAQRFFRSGKALRWFDWAHEQLRLRGRVRVVGGRFIPGARTALTFAAGTLDMSWRRFITADIPGAAIFTTVYTMLGYLGGQLFRNNLWLPLLVALAIASLLTTAAEACRRLPLDRNGG